MATSSNTSLLQQTEVNEMIPNRLGKGAATIKEEVVLKTNNEYYTSLTPEQFDLYVAKWMMNKSENCEQRGIEFKLSFVSCRNLLKAKKCYYTGVLLTKTKTDTGKPKPTDFTIDRIDSSKPYQKGNVVVCCHFANQLKNQVESSKMFTTKQAMNVFKKTIERGVK